MERENADLERIKAKIAKLLNLCGARFKRARSRKRHGQSPRYDGQVPTHPAGRA
ncbi:hypothetical protein GNAINCEL_00023 [Serratia phage KKP 3709]|nr:hypothetical protein GNAINCEL_00023 [Serratia phage KKP 3709]